MAVLVGLLVALVSVFSVQASAEKFPRDMQYRVEFEYENKIDVVTNALGEVSRLFDMQVIPSGLIIPLIPVHVFVSDKNMKKWMMVLVGAKVEAKYLLKSYDVSGGQVYHFAPSGVPLAIAFRGMSPEEIQKTVNYLKTAPLNKNVSLLESILPAAHADDQAKNGVVDSTSSGHQDPGLAEKIALAFKGCTVGLVDGAYTVLVDPFVKFGEGMYYAVTDPGQMWDNTMVTAGKIGDAVMGAVKEPYKTAKVIIKKRTSMSVEEGSKSNCALVGGGATGAYMLKTAKGVLELRSAVPTASGPTVYKTAVEQEALGLKTAEKIGMKTGVRKEVLKAIDEAAEKFVENPYSVAKNRYDWKVETVDRFLKNARKGFKPKSEAGTAAFDKEWKAHLTDYVQAVRNSGDTGDLLQLLRVDVEKKFSFNEFYNAWYHRGISSGGRQQLTGGANEGNLVFTPGPTPDSVRVHGFSWQNDPVAILNAYSTKPINIEGLKVHQPRKTEGISGYSLIFEAIVTPK